MTKPKQRGGKRKGAGRHCKEDGVKRVAISLTVHPDTLAKIDTLGEGMSRGAYVDLVMEVQ